MTERAGDVLREARTRSAPVADRRRGPVGIAQSVISAYESGSTRARRADARTARRGHRPRARTRRATLLPTGSSACRTHGSADGCDADVKRSSRRRRDAGPATFRVFGSVARGDLGGLLEPAGQAVLAALDAGAIRRSVRGEEEARGGREAEEVLVERAGQRGLVLEHRRRALADHHRVGLGEPHELGQLAQVSLEIRPREPGPPPRPRSCAASCPRAIIPPMRAPVAAMILALALGACASSSLNLPYKPEVQPSGATISAAYTIVADRLRVEIATDGRRLERAQVIRPDGALLEAQTIEYTPPVSGGGSPVDIGFGIGSFGSRGGVGTGVGVSTGTGGRGSSPLRWARPPSPRSRSPTRGRAPGGCASSCRASSPPTSWWASPRGAPRRAE